MVSSNVFATALGYLQARKMSRAFTLLSVAQLVCILSLNLFFVAWLARGVEGILLSQFLVTGTFAIGLAAWVLGQTGLAVSLARMRTFLAFGVPMIGWSLAVFAVNAADRMVLSRVGSLTDVGVFSLANRCGTALLVFIVTPFSCFWAAERLASTKQPDGKDGLALALFLASTLLGGLPPLLGIAVNAVPVIAFPIVLAGVGFLEPAEKRWMIACGRALIGRLQMVASTAAGDSR